MAQRLRDCLQWQHSPTGNRFASAGQSHRTHSRRARGAPVCCIGLAGPLRSGGAGVFPIRPVRGNALIWHCRCELFGVALFKESVLIGPFRLVTLPSVGPNQVVSEVRGEAGPFQVAQIVVNDDDYVSVHTHSFTSRSSQ
jgi:hypothetical protein